MNDNLLSESLKPRGKGEKFGIMQTKSLRIALVLLTYWKYWLVAGGKNSTVPFEIDERRKTWPKLERSRSSEIERRCDRFFEII